MAKERLVGSDGKLSTITFDTAATGDGTDDLNDLTASTEGGLYKIVAIGDPTGFATGYSVGDIFYDDGTLVLETGDEVQFLIESEQADVTSFNLEINKAEIDVTVLSDNQRRYRTGKTDMTGSMEGITTLGETDSAGWVINNFLRVLDQASDGSVTVNSVDDSPIFIKGTLQKDTSTGETEAFFFAEVVLLGSSLGASGEDAQSFSSNFRIAAGSTEPTYYTRAIA